MALSLFSRPTAGQRRKRRSTKTHHKKIAKVGKTPAGKTIYRGAQGAKFTRGLHNRRNYL